MTDKLCIAPFVHSHVGATYERKLCCVAKTIPGMDKISTDEYWNSEYLKQVRLDMKAGKLVSDCQFCYDYEDHGVASLRHSLNGLYDVQEVVSRMEEDGTMLDPPSYFDYRTITCNLQCTTCDDANSSRHIPIVKQMFDKTILHRVDVEYERKLGSEIVEGLRNRTVRNIYWAGGEPMLMAAHWDVIDEMERLHADPSYREYIASIPMFYNTNMTILYRNNRLIPEILSKFDVTIWASIDGVEETFEYCRDGAKWENVKENWLVYKQYIPKTSITSVLSAPVLMDIDRYLDFFDSHGSNSFNHQYLQNIYNNLLDIRLWPQHLFDQIIDHAIERTKQSVSESREDTLSVLEMYKNQKKDFQNVDYAFIKNEIQRRDKFLKNSQSFESLLKKIHTPAYEWYVGI